MLIREMLSRRNCTQSLQPSNLEIALFLRIPVAKQPYVRNRSTNSSRHDSSTSALHEHQISIDHDISSRLLVQARVLAPKSTSLDGVAALDMHLQTLRSFFNADGNLKEAFLSDAVAAAGAIREMVSFAVNTKATGLRGLQSSIVGSGAVEALIQIARRGEPIAYEALQILSYRNTVACDQIIASGVVDTISIDLPSSGLPLQSAMCFLLTALAAFSDSTHTAIVASGLVPQLVALCRPSNRASAADAGDRHARSQVENRAAAVLRNLAHNPKHHMLLVQAGAVDAFLEIMKQASDPVLRINAAVAVACLVGHEENHQRLQIDSSLVEEMLEVLDASCQGIMCHGTFWTVWKLCQGLANLTINDRNKELISQRGGVDLLGEVLFGKHHNNEATQRYALSAIWNLAFHDSARKQIVEFPGLVDAIRNILATTESPKTKEVAKGALWTLGLERDVKTLTGSATGAGYSSEDSLVGTVQATAHVMLSYEWGCQQSVLLIKSELQKAGENNHFLSQQRNRDCRWHKLV
ncbi:hypothetical protein CEUSTIGMA_g3746.t1 [Chlamydomonas eustigma]|uniref:Armadillo repeat-containing domain-containing protein n=1 Tax=Chlamydomonas eustigma TaxID=1157962 RepID=A0A250WZP3_9CHLO|nr:hypothetical protein CEUSTIGMA_g3746.t1 [Chlamydomonas eustigma]|eukprot:GAX76301.1 hypothetical protein CEUSTIGMA_g3746.t1 [Chlamydomonas eustigma]